MMPIAKTKLEEICVLYLNHQPRVRPVSQILLNRPGTGSANWSFDRFEPRLDIRDIETSFAAVKDLQSVFRMVV
jgi:hypothetical protein